MSLRDFVRPWAGVGYRHTPAGATRTILDDTYIGRASTNRWSQAGTPTYYFASDLGIVVAEYARHIASELPAGAPERQARSLWSVEINLDRALDLRDPQKVGAMGTGPIKDWILDLDATQASATYLRAQVDIQALIVPSVAFLDRLDRFNVVVYRDRIDLRAVFGEPAHVRDFVLDAVGTSGDT